MSEQDLIDRIFGRDHHQHQLKRYHIRGKIPMSTNPSGRDFMLVPNIDGMNDIAQILPFLNLYRDNDFHHLECFSFRKRYLPSVLKFLEEIPGAQMRKLKGDNCFNFDLTYNGCEIVVFLRYSAHDSGRLALYAMTNSSESILLDFVEKIPTTDDQDSSFELAYYFMSAKNGLTHRDLYVKAGEFADIYSDLYPDIDIVKLVEQYNSANEPILMLYGDPGVGKTTFIKYMIAHGDFKNAAYIKDPTVMERGELWSSLTAESYDLVIFDDLDTSLLPRSKNESAFMSQLLSYSDGIFTQGKVKVIITTNQTVKEIDSALVRPGRCFDFLKLNALPREDALRFWTETLKLDPANFDRLFQGKEVTQAALMSEAFRTSSSAGARSYVKRGNNRYTLDTKLGELGIQASDGQSAKASF